MGQKAQALAVNLCAGAQLQTEHNSAMDPFAPNNIILKMNQYLVLCFTSPFSSVYQSAAAPSACFSQANSQTDNWNSLVIHILYRKRRQLPYV
ncbi:MAG: hypothetical protein H0W99_04630 [Acidobacteria bacterium]|nr:hypothetical protein [Acidobacteriota bacterium]